MSKANGRTITLAVAPHTLTLEVEAKVITMDVTGDLALRVQWA